MANWWENMSFLPGNWSNIQSGAQSNYDPNAGQMNYMNPSGSGYFMPFTPGQMTGQGLTPGIGQASTAPTAGTGMDPYYGYGALFGAQGGQNPQTLTALGQPGAGNTALAAMAPNQQTAQGNMGRNAPWSPNIPPVAGPPGAPTTQGNVTYSPVGSQESLLDRIFRGSVTGQGGGPIGKMLSSLASGQLPPALAEQIISGTNESFGKMGARFGTDLGTAEARGLAQASEAQSLNAIKEILGLGGTTAGFQFTRGENALQRAMQEFIAQQQMDPINQLLPALLGSLGGGG